jgi:CubicO group peptidase (beta-lactamase class C family)
MSGRYSLGTVVCLVATCVLPVGSVRAGDAADVDRHIATVESHLIPAVRIKGRPLGQLAERMHELHVPGVSVAVIDDYRIDWTKGYGLADSQTKTPITPATLFQAGSGSRPIAAMAALKLVEAGSLSLDRDINSQLKSWKVPDNKFTQKHAVDLREILSHRAGFNVPSLPGYAVDKPLPTLEQILEGVRPPANTRPIRVERVPGQAFRPSAGGFVVLEQLVTDVTGKPFPQQMDDLVLAPLAMTASTDEQPLPAASVPRAASGHNRQGKPIAGRWHVYPETAAAGLWTTPSDVARYVIEVELAHAGKSHKVLSRKTVDEMLTPQGGAPIGLGPFLAGTGNSRRFGHPAEAAGFNGRFVGYVDRGQGAIVMTNADSGGALADELLNAIAFAYGWPDYLPPERTIIKLDPKIMDGLVGNYSLGLFGQVKVERRGEVLFASSAMGGESELFFESETKFFTNDPSISGQFTRDAQGQVTEVIIRFSGEEIHAKKKP